MISKLYNLPQLYDNAFSWDLSQEIDFFKRVFETHVPFPVRHILEPACGSGRFLRTLPSYGYHVTGYDVSPAMVQYATDSVAAAGCEGSVRIVLADMVSAEIPGEFDAAFNSINSIGYLHSDDNVVSHLKATGSSLREGGIYLVHLNFAHEGELPDGDHWTMDRDGINVKISWRILSSPLKKPIRATAGPCGRNTALRSLAESLDSTRLRALSSATMTRPRLQSDFINGLLAKTKNQS